MNLKQGVSKYGEWAVFFLQAKNFLNIFSRLLKTKNEMKNNNRDNMCPSNRQCSQPGPLQKVFQPLT